MEQVVGVVATLELDEAVVVDAVSLADPVVVVPFISERSIISPPSVTALPATLCPPPRTESSRPAPLAAFTASSLHAAPALQEREGRAPAAGLLQLELALAAKPLQLAGAHKAEQPLLESHGQLQWQA